MIIRYVFTCLLCVVLGLHATAQTIPVMIINAAPETDAVAATVVKALENSITISGKFTVFTGDPLGFPKNGIVISIDALELRSPTDKAVIGSTISLLARAPSPTEQDYFKWIGQQMIFFPKNGSVSDAILNFLAFVVRNMHTPTRGSG